MFLVFDDGYHYECYALARLGWPHDDRAQRRGANAWVGDGSLVIEARREHIEHRRYTSAGLITKGKREFAYGRSPQRRYVDYVRVYRRVGQRT